MGIWTNENMNGEMGQWENGEMGKMESPFFPSTGFSEQWARVGRARLLSTRTDTNTSTDTKTKPAGESEERGYAHLSRAVRAAAERFRSLGCDGGTAEGGPARVVWRAMASAASSAVAKLPRLRRCPPLQWKA